MQTSLYWSLSWTKGYILSSPAQKRKLCCAPVRTLEHIYRKECCMHIWARVCVAERDILWLNESKVSKGWMIGHYFVIFTSVPVGHKSPRSPAYTAPHTNILSSNHTRSQNTWLMRRYEMQQRWVRASASRNQKGDCVQKPKNAG